MVSDLIDTMIRDEAGEALAAFQIRAAEDLDVALATALVRDDAGDAARSGIRNRALSPRAS